MQNTCGNTISVTATVCRNAAGPSECVDTDGDMTSRISSDPEVKTVVQWLKSVPVDRDTISKVNLLFILCSTPHPSPPEAGFGVTRSVD